MTLLSSSPHRRLVKKIANAQPNWTPSTVARSTIVLDDFTFQRASCGVTSHSKFRLRLSRGFVSLGGGGGWPIFLYMCPPQPCSRLFRKIYEAKASTGCFSSSKWRHDSSRRQSKALPAAPSAQRLEWRSPLNKSHAATTESLSKKTNTPLLQLQTDEGQHNSSDSRRWDNGQPLRHGSNENARRGSRDSAECQEERS